MHFDNKKVYNTKDIYPNLYIHMYVYLYRERDNKYNTLQFETLLYK